MKIRNTFIAASCLLVSSGVFAQDYNNHPNIYAGGVYYHFDGDRQQKDDLGFLIGGEVPIAERWGFAVEYWDISSDMENLAGNSDVNYWRVAGNYHLQPHNKWQPYLSGGVGKLNIEPNSAISKTKNTVFDLGAGVKYMLSNNLMLRGDAKVLFPNGSAGMDYALGLSIAYNFGPRSRSTPVVEETPQVVEAAPVAAAVVAPPPADTDMDGVIDSLDNCPDTPVELAVDESGCPILDISQMRQTLDVQFDTNMSDIKPEYQDVIADFAEFMTTYSNTTVVIEGHTDSDGSESYNQSLSEARATAIMDELINNYDIDSSRLSAIGYGETRPTASNQTSAGKAQNRRIKADVSIEIEEQRRR